MCLFTSPVMQRAGQPAHGVGSILSFPHQQTLGRGLPLHSRSRRQQVHCTAVVVQEVAQARHVHEKVCNLPHQLTAAVPATTTWVGCCCNTTGCSGMLTRSKNTRRHRNIGSGQTACFKGPAWRVQSQPRQQLQYPSRRPRQSRFISKCSTHASSASMFPLWAHSRGGMCLQLCR